MGSLLRRFVTIYFVLVSSAWAQGHAQEPATAPPQAADVRTHRTTPKNVTVYGARIHYLEAGRGPVVVLLHGLGGSSGDFALNVPALAQNFRVIVPDQLGFGQSAKPVIDYRIGTYVDFLDRFLSELGIERASLVGNSFGGWVAASYALAHPERVERLVLVDAAGFALPVDFDLKQLRGLNASTREGIRQLIERGFYNAAFFSTDAFVDAAFTARINSGDGVAVRSLIELIASREESLDNRLSAIKSPTLVIWGRQDGIVPLADGERFRQQIPGAVLVVFDRCGHLPHVEKAAEFNAAVAKFLVPATK